MRQLGGWVALGLAVTLLVAATIQPQTPAAASNRIAGTGQSTCGTVITIDTPTSGASVAGVVSIGGWAADPTAADGTGVTSVDFALNARPEDGGTALGSAYYGDPRPAVGDQLGDPRFANSGFSAQWDTTGLPDGAYNLIVIATGPCGVTTTTLPLTLASAAATPGANAATAATATPSASPSPQAQVVTGGCMTMKIDLPLANQPAEPPLLVVGYAYDPNSKDNTGVTAVTVYLGPKSDSKILGTLRYGLFRRDLQEGTGTTTYANSGFSGSLPPTGLPASGTVMLYVYATGPCGEGYAAVPVSLTSSANAPTPTIAANATVWPTVSGGVFGSAGNTGTVSTVPAGTNPVALAPVATIAGQPTPPAIVATATTASTSAGGALQSPGGTTAPVATNLTAPTNLMVTQNAGNSVTITWTASTGGTIDSYEVFQSTDGTTYASRGVVPGTAAALGNLTTGQNYYFQVAARAGASIGPHSTALGPIQPGVTAPTSAPGTVAGALSPPSNLVFSSQTGDTSTLSWTASPSTGLTGYQVYVSVNNGTATPVGSPVPATQTTLSMSQLSPGARYSFYVVAVAGTQQSAPSQVLGPCSTGQSCLGSAGSIGSSVAPNASALAYANRVVQVTWSTVPGASQYRVYRGTAGQNASLIYTAPVGTLGYSDTVPATGVYNYYITAVVNNVETAPSNTVQVNVTS